METNPAQKDAGGGKNKRYFKETDNSESSAVQFAEVTRADTWEKPFRLADGGGVGEKKKRKHSFKIDRNAVARHSRGPKATTRGIKTDFFQQKLRRNEIYTEFATEQAARTEILRIENEGLVIFVFIYLIILFDNIHIREGTLKMKTAKIRPSIHKVKLSTMWTLRRQQNISI